MRHLRRARMEHAARLLETTFLTVKEVTFLSGFNDVSHFVRDFKKRYGVRPSTFRGRAQRSHRASHGAGSASECANI